MKMGNNYIYVTNENELEIHNATDESKKILQYNRKRLYKLPKKYKCLNEVLTEELKDFLLKTIAFWLNANGCIFLKPGKYAYFLGTHIGTYKIRRKTTKGVTNRYINYLCAIGLLHKLPQKIKYDFNRRILRDLTKINRNLLAYNYNYVKEPLNTFLVEKYDKALLDKCENRAKRLLEAKITTGNMKYTQLAVNGLEDIAKEVYCEERDASVKKKEKEYDILKTIIEFLISEKGFATKQMIYDNCELSEREINKLFTIYRNDFKKHYQYKAPTKEDKEKYNLENNKWIITKL